jgi:predicted ATPase
MLEFTRNEVPEGADGRDFYDEGYSDDEDEAKEGNDGNTGEDPEQDVLNGGSRSRIVFSPDRFYGRKSELQLCFGGGGINDNKSNGSSTGDRSYNGSCNGSNRKDSSDSSSSSDDDGHPTSENGQAAANCAADRHDGYGPSSLASSLPPVVIVDGSSGTGKSALVRRFFKELEADVAGGGTPTEGADADAAAVPNFFVVAGKYDELQGADPFSAILEALSGFCCSLLERGGAREDGRDLLRIRRAIRNSLGNETSALTALIPGLADVLGEDGTRTTPSANANDERVVNAATAELPILSMTGDSWNRVRYLFQKLFCAICAKDRPLIMFLDDLQWADDASLDLIDSLLKDASLQYLMFIACVRGNEVDRGGKLSRLIDEMLSTSAREVAHLELLNLSMEELGEFVADTLKLDEAETGPLTEVIYGKTRGNIFFSMQTMEELHRRNILFFSTITFRWDWNLKGIEFKSALSDDVVEVVASKIQSLPEKLQRALVIASYTRSSLDVQTLFVLLQADGVTLSTKELVGFLDMAVLEGLLLNTVGSNFYRFAHDRIQQAAYWMVPSGQERDQLRVLVGGKLVELSGGPKGKDWMLFVAADHLNSSTGHGQNTLSLIRLNLECGKKASSVAAFVPASLYLRLALQYLRRLDKNHWENHYDLSLTIFRAISDTELCLGHFDSGQELCQQILDHARVLEDKLPTVLVLADSKGRQNQMAEALALCQEALISLNAIPKRLHFVHMLKDLQIVKFLFNRHADSDILELPRCQDDRMAWIMDFLTQCSLRAYRCGNTVEFMFCIVRKLRMTFKHGLTGGSAHAFACYGFFLMGPGNDAKSALRMSRLAREIQEKTDPSSRPTRALTLMVLSYYVEAWTFPRERIMETLQEAHRSGMASGNIEMGFQSWGMCNVFAQSSGYPLEPVESTGTEIMSQLRLYSVDTVRAVFEECRLVIMYLTGRKKLDWLELEPSELTLEKSEVHRNLYAYLSRLELGVYFGNLKFAERMSKLVRPYVTCDGSFVALSKELFYSALAYAGLARETGRQKYQAKANKLAKKMRHLCRSRGLNILHKCLLMEAEVLSFRCRSPDKLIDSYDSAISTAIEIGYTQDAALGSELAGASLLAFGNETRGYQYLHQSRALWRQCDAHLKARLLFEQHGRKLDSCGIETSLPVGENDCSSMDLSAKTMDLDLLSGTTVKTDVHMKKGHACRTNHGENGRKFEDTLSSYHSTRCASNADPRDNIPVSR